MADPKRLLAQAQSLKGRTRAPPLRQVKKTAVEPPVSKVREAATAEQPSEETPSAGKDAEKDSRKRKMSTEGEKPAETDGLKKIKKLREEIADGRRTIMIAPLHQPNRR